MGNKISLLVYEWPLINAKFGEWVDFSTFAQIWLKFQTILEKSGDFAQNLAQYWSDIGVVWSSGRA